MPSDDIVIAARNLTKRYRLFGHPGDRVKQFMSLGLRRYYEEFTALRDVSCEIRRGETVGIIGRNGSGKSTLLQLVCGILKPTAGTIRVNGRVSALLELGAGFNPEFTGRENVYFQGAILGLDKAAMDARFDAIAAFADIGEFIDQPVRTYSSGMFVRLAFAVASHVDPDILVVDEALAVGDAVFQQKCFDRIYDLQSRGATMVVVSHNPYQLERLCGRVAVMDRGRLSPLAPAREALTLYQELVHRELSPQARNDLALREGTYAVRFERVEVEGARDPADGAFRTHAPLRIVAEIVADRPVDNVRFRFELCAGGDLVAMMSTIGLTEGIAFHGRHRIAFTMPRCQLTSGWYHINAVAVGRNVRLDTWPRAAEFSVLLKDTAALDLTGDRGIYVCQGDWEIA
jgi:ABC-type polysaccharide/polyol phosphate transport system ATPase subunit